MKPFIDPISSTTSSPDGLSNRIYMYIYVDTYVHVPERGINAFDKYKCVYYRHDDYSYFDRRAKTPKMTGTITCECVYSRLTL